MRVFFGVAELPRYFGIKLRRDEMFYGFCLFVYLVVGEVHHFGEVVLPEAVCTCYALPFFQPFWCEAHKSVVVGKQSLLYHSL